MPLGVLIFKHIVLGHLKTRYLEHVMVLGQLKIINFRLGTNGTLMALGVPVFKRIILGHLKSGNWNINASRTAKNHLFSIWDKWKINGLRFSR